MNLFKILLMLTLGSTTSFLIKNNIIRNTRLFATKKLNFEKKYSARSPGQSNYKTHLYDKNLNIVICNGPAGSGKTALACEYSLDSLHSKKCDKIIITRPTISMGEDLGFLPGDINNKMLPWDDDIDLVLIGKSINNFLRLLYSSSLFTSIEIKARSSVVSSA